MKFISGLPSVYLKGIHTLAAEMFKIKNDMSPEIIPDIFLPGTENHFKIFS